MKYFAWTWIDIVNWLLIEIIDEIYTLTLFTIRIVVDKTFRFYYISQPISGAGGRFETIS